MEDAITNQEDLIKGLEVVVDIFGKLSKKFNKTFFDLDDKGRVTGWNADVFLTSDSERFYITQYSHLDDLRLFPESLLYRVDKENVQSLYSTVKFFPTKIIQNIIINNLRKPFYQHENERKMVSFPLSIGETTFGVFGKEVGDAFENVLYWSGSLIPMKKYGVSSGKQAVFQDVKRKDIEVPEACGVMQIFGGEDISLIGPPGFR